MTTEKRDLFHEGDIVLVRHTTGCHDVECADTLPGRFRCGETAIVYRYSVMDGLLDLRFRSPSGAAWARIEDVELVR